MFAYSSSAAQHNLQAFDIIIINMHVVFNKWHIKLYLIYLRVELARMDPGRVEYGMRYICLSLPTASGHASSADIETLETVFCEDD